MVYIYSRNFFNFRIVKLRILTPFNKIWFKFGVLLGNLISPIILGIIFFDYHSNVIDNENF